jgi:DNA polymerase
MRLITVDFETYYDKQFSLSKITTEEYIRNPEFEVIGVGLKVDNEPTQWASGTHEQIKEYLHEFDWEDTMVLAHNTMFDGAILSWIFDVHPRFYTDTLCIGRALHGVDVGGSLKAMAERYGIGEKGTEVIHALGKRRTDFTEKELDRYGDYCVNDVELTHKLFHIFLNKGFPKKELKLIDLTLRMFTEPTLELDTYLLEERLTAIKAYKEMLLVKLGVQKEDLMSNPKFARALEDLGVDPPKKVSPRTGKETYAFAKSDEGFKALQDHEDTRVQALVAARLGTKSTLEETRTERFLGIGERGKMPVPIKYYAAHTGRWGGADKINLQNLPSRGPNAKKLKSSIIAPDGYMLVDADSAQIEARVLAWLAEQDDLIQAFANNEDVYVKMASKIYGIPEDQVIKEQRFVGKTTILGCGYGMGAVRFQEQLKNFGVDIDLDECRRIITIYRESNWKIEQLWRSCQNMLRGMVSGNSYQIGRVGVLQVNGPELAIKLPSGLLLRYEDLQAYETDKGYQFDYKTRRMRTKIYGGKVVENVTQAIARCIIGEQMLKISERYKVVLTVHDSIVACVPEAEVDEAQDYIETCMRTVPVWAEGLPIDCESGVGKSYGECG